MIQLPLNPAALARLTEMRCLHADATRADVKRACDLARQHSLHGICVNTAHAELASSLLEETDLKTIACVGYPFGAMDADAKRYEVEVALDLGAREIETVLNVGKLKDREDTRLLRELRDIVAAAEERPVSVVIQTGFLTRDEKIRVCDLLAESGIKSVSTATTLDRSAPSVEDIRLLREHLEPDFGVKASWENIDHTIALALLEAGATRLTISDADALLRGFEQ